MFFPREDLLSYSTIKKFDCHGEWKKKGIEINPEGFYHMYSETVNDTAFIDKNSQIMLFGRKFDFWSALLTDWDWLYTMTSMNLTALLNTEIKGPDPFSEVKDLDAATVRNEAACIRADLSVFFYYIDYYLKVYLQYSEKFNLSPEQILEIDKKSWSLKILLRKFDWFFYSSQFLLQCTSEENSMLPSEAFQFIHSNLDFRWLFILIRFKLSEIRLSFNCDFSCNYYSKTDVILVLMWELIYTSAIKFQWQDDDFVEDIFICPCIKELWMLLSKKLGIETFWDYFNKVLQTILEINRLPNNQELEDLGWVLLRPFASMDAKEFTLRFLSKFSKLKDYIKMKLDYPPVGPGVFIPVYSTVKEYLNSNPSEKSLRSTIPVIESIINEWPLETESVIVMIWEYMYERINTPFYVPGTKNRRRETEESCEEFLNEIKSRLHPGRKNKDENSFGLFLKLMVNQVRKLRSEGHKVVTLHSRFYLRFENKIDEFLNYNEVALYRVSSLFLTAALAYDVEKETQKLRELMNIRNTKQLSDDERIVKWKTQSAILLLLVENGLNGIDITNDIKQEINLARFMNDVNYLSIFLECLTVLVNHRNDHLSSMGVICSFMGSWMENYSKLAPSSGRSSLLSIFYPLIQDLRGDSCWWDGDEKEKLQSVLCSFVLPVLTANVSSQFANTSASFLSFLMKYKKWKEAYSFYKVWAGHDDENCTAFANFITHFNALENIEKLGFISCRYDQDIVQCFVKYHLLNERTTTSCKLSKAVASLPSVKRYMSASDESFLNENQEYLLRFIQLFGKFLYRAGPSEKTHLEGLFHDYFQKLGEFVIKPLVERKSKFAINTIYRCSASLTSECYSVIYSESRSCILEDIVNNIFMPMKWYTNYKFMPNPIKEAAASNLPLFIRGLLKINKKYDFVNQTVTDLLEYYFPEDYDSRHPFIECLLDAELTIPFSTALANKFLSCSSNDSKREKCVLLLSSVSNTFTKQVIFNNIIEGLLRLIMQESGNGTLKWPLDYIKKNMNAVDLTCPYIASIENAIRKIYRTECGKRSLNLIKLLRHLRNLCGRLVGSFFIFLKEEMREAERRKDQDQMSYLRQMEADLKSLLI